MKLEDFKKLHGIDVLKFYPAKDSSSKRFTAGFISKEGKDSILVTREDFDPKKENKFVYANSIKADENGVLIENLFWLSNEEPKEAAFEL